MIRLWNYDCECQISDTCSLIQALDANKGLVRIDLDGGTEHFGRQMRLIGHDFLAPLHTTCVIPHGACIDLLLLPIAELEAHLIILIKSVALDCANDGRALHGVLKVNEAEQNFFLDAHFLNLVVVC